MSALLPLAAEAASGIVSAMTSDAWSQIREYCADFLRRHLTGEDQVGAVAELDAHHRSLSVLPEQALEATADAYARITADRLAALLEDSPESANDLRALLAKTNEHLAGAPPKAEIKLDNVRAGRDVIVANGNIDFGGLR